MNASRAFEAPGKLMLAGEYSVLGAEGIAVCVAVAPGLRLETRSAPRWELVRDGGEAWREGAPVPETLRFAHAAWAGTLASLERDGIAPSPHRLVTINPRGRDDARKPGLGGSASSCALVSAALHALGGLELPRSRERILERALAAHRQVQGGRGSGYDVATVVLGGLVRWAHGRGARVRWPSGLELIAGYSGRSASTQQMLERVYAIPELVREAELRALGDPVAAFAVALEAGDLSALRESIRESQRALAAWDRSHDLGIVTPELARLIERAAALGVTAKISGAGAGDSVVALDDDLERLDAVVRAWRAEGFVPLEFGRDERGVREGMVL